MRAEGILQGLSCMLRPQVVTHLQVRYQERKKKKVSSHAATAAELESKVEELKALQAQAEQLEKANAFLEAACKQKVRAFIDRVSVKPGGCALP